MPTFERPVALMIPIVTVWLSWNGLPMASTYSPTAAREESPQGSAARPRALDLDHRDVGDGIGADELAPEAPVVGGGDGDLAGVLDDVVVGHDEAVRAHDHARSPGSSCAPPCGMRRPGKSWPKNSRKKGSLPKGERSAR